MSRDQNAGRSHSMKIDNRSIERVEEFKYLGTTLTNKNSIQEEIKSRLKVGNVCYYSVQNLLSSSLLTKKLKIKIYRTIILPVVMYGCETWSLTLKEERRLRVFENKVLRRVFLVSLCLLSKCWDGSPVSKLSLHASHVALPKYILVSERLHVCCIRVINLCHRVPTQFQLNKYYYYYYYMIESTLSSTLT